MSCFLPVIQMSRNWLVTAATTNESPLLSARTCPSRSKTIGSANMRQTTSTLFFGKVAHCRTARPIAWFGRSLQIAFEGIYAAINGRIETPAAFQDFSPDFSMMGSSVGVNRHFPVLWWKWAPPKRKQHWIRERRSSLRRYLERP